MRKEGNNRSSRICLRHFSVRTASVPSPQQLRSVLRNISSLFEYHPSRPPPLEITIHRRGVVELSLRYRQGATDNRRGELHHVSSTLLSSSSFSKVNRRLTELTIPAHLRNTASRIQLNAQQWPPQSIRKHVPQLIHRWRSPEYLLSTLDLACEHSGQVRPAADRMDCRAHG